MKAQSAIDYCLAVKDESLLREKRMFKMPVKDDNSSLVRLNETDAQFVYEPSFFEGYEFLVREEVAAKLHRINDTLLSQEMALYIRSGWRSHEHQRQLRENRRELLVRQHPEKTEAQINAIISHFVASEKQSMHSTGGAVDVLIYDHHTKKILDFGVNDGESIELGVECYPFHPNISKEARMNRELLLLLFEREDFVVSLKEFWHFDYGNVAWAVGKNREFAIYGPIFN